MTSNFRAFFIQQIEQELPIAGRDKNGLTIVTALNHVVRVTAVWKWGTAI
jgi:hypothetical protein